MSDPTEATILDLLRRAKRGDRRAREDLFTILGDTGRFGRVLRAMAHRLLCGRQRARRLIDTEDVVQSALGVAFGKAEDFRGETEGELYAWLRSILRTKVDRAARRKDQRVDRVVLDYIRVGHDSDRMKELVDDELRDLMRKQIGKLPASERIVIELRLRDAETHEIARLLNLETAAVRKRESRAVKRLRSALADL